MFTWGISAHINRFVYSALFLGIYDYLQKAKKGKLTQVEYCERELTEGKIWKCNYYPLFWVVSLYICGTL